MIRMARLTDYGIMLLTYFARDPERHPRSARQLAQVAHLPVPTVSKVLKRLAHKGLLATHRGTKGGFHLSQPAESITVAEIIDAIEGSVTMTQCSADHGQCGLEPTCIVRNNWRKINKVVLNALERITLAEMTRPMELSVAPVELKMGARTP